MATPFHNQEAEYEQFLHEGTAFVCNNLETGRQYHKVHRSDCNILNRAGPAKTGLHTSVAKLGSHDLDDLIQELTRDYGPEGTGFTFCQFCFKQ